MPASNRNTAVLLTPRPSGGGSAIAVVRLQGPYAATFLGKFFSKSALPQRCVHGEIRDGQTIVDDAVVVLNQGKTQADICLHGGAWIIEQMMNLARREGFEIVQPALPVPREALDDDVSEIEREVLQFLPLALTEPAIRMLLNQPAAWRAASNGAFDFAANLKDRTLWRLLHPPTIAIIGEPNVGKSTLANRLFGQQRSITADVPGTTRDWVGEMVNIAGMPATLIDTPGVRQTHDAIERGAIAASREKIGEADLLLLILDATSAPAVPPAFSDRQMVVVNKIDQPAGWDFSVLDVIGISAKTGDGCEELCQAIQRRLGIVDLDEKHARWWTARQQSALCDGNLPE